MVFNSTLFIFLFLPVFLALYFITPGKLKNVVLIIFSIFFYTWGRSSLILLLLGSVIVNFFGAKALGGKHKKVILILLLLFNIGLLAWFKYCNFGIETFNSILGLFHLQNMLLKPVENLLLPLGISFYTFRAIAYSMDVYRKKTDPSADFIEFSTWFMMFPLVSAGPIVRYSEIREQLSQRTVDLALFTEGVARFVTGLAKKVLIAGAFSTVVQYVFATKINRISMEMSWVGITAFVLEVYFDFSGYSDMAIGIGKMLGFRFPENFNYPYTARNIREFWRRWHITLSNWLRDYLFLPVAYSLSRKLKNDTYLKIKTDKIIYAGATLVTFLVCGLWHGAAWSFVAWGLWFAIFLTIEQLFLGRLLKKMWIPLQHLYTLLVIILSFVIFKSENLSDAFAYMGRMFSFSPGAPAYNSYIQYFAFTRETLVATVAGVLFSMPLYNTLRSFADKMASTRPVLQWVLNAGAILVLAVLFLVCLVYMASNTYDPFIYLKF